MSRPVTQVERLFIIPSNMAMKDFGHARRMEWLIYGARHQQCPKCSQPPNTPCINLSDVRRGVTEPRVNRQPHPERIDWERIHRGLAKRGYLRGYSG